MVDSLKRAGLVLLVCTTSLRAELPRLIPRELLFGNPERSSPQLSPDGRRIAWLAPDPKGVQNVWVQPVAGGTPRLLTNERERPIFWYRWAADARHILYLQNRRGDEVNHLYSVDLADGNVRDLTPFVGVKAQNIRTDLAHPDTVLVALNLRDRKVFDMYHVDLQSGAITIAAKNPGDVLSWTTDHDFVVRAAIAFDPKTAQTIIRVRNSATAPWRDVVKMPFERALFGGQVVGGSLIAGFDRGGKTLLIHSALHSDKGRLVRIDSKSGKETEVVASDLDSDVDDTGGGPVVITNPVTHVIEAVRFNYVTPHWVFLDDKVRADFERIEKEVPATLTLRSRDRADRTWIVEAWRSDLAPAYYAFDRATKRLTPLFSDYPKLAEYQLASKKPIIIPARDGLKLVSYLTVPPGVEPKNLPLVLDIHGGPWARDSTIYDAEVQLLANRGYAVLQVNYRGSTGFGLKFLNASTQQFGRAMQEDLYDAVRWTIREGIADPKRIAALGWSGGGYATLRALSQRPDLFACGVDAVGPADIATLFRSFPTYWEGIMTRWRLRIGDVEHEDALNREISPLYHVTAIRAPLLIAQGANDVRVTIANADAMVKALRENQRQVVYVVYADEGHGFARPENNLDFYGRVEEFLAKHLGSRAEPWKKIEGSTAELH